MRMDHEILGFSGGLRNTRRQLLLRLGYFFFVDFGTPGVRLASSRTSTTRITCE